MRKDYEDEARADYPLTTPEHIDAVERADESGFGLSDKEVGEFYNTAVKLLNIAAQRFADD